MELNVPTSEVKKKTKQKILSLNQIRWRPIGKKYGF